MAELVYQTIGQLLDEQTKKYPKREALVYADRNLRMTYEELNRQRRLVARGLAKKFERFAEGKWLDKKYRNIFSLFVVFQ